MKMFTLMLNEIKKDRLIRYNTSIMPKQKTELKSKIIQIIIVILLVCLLMASL